MLSNITNPHKVSNSVFIPPTHTPLFPTYDPLTSFRPMFSLQIYSFSHTHTESGPLHPDVMELVFKDGGGGLKHQLQMLANRSFSPMYTVPSNSDTKVLRSMLFTCVYENENFCLLLALNALTVQETWKSMYILHANSLVSWYGM